MEDLNKQIEKIIEENLPKQMGEVLQKRIKELEKIELKYKDISDLYNNQSKVLSEVKKERDTIHKELIIKEEMLKDIAEREKSVQERELKLENAILKIHHSESEKRANQMIVLLGIAFSNFNSLS
jgi:t-SNARE complex subunit (syntaxin)